MSKAARKRMPDEEIGVDFGTEERGNHDHLLKVQETDADGRIVLHKRVALPCILDAYLERETITPDQHRAGSKLYRDWYVAGNTMGHTVAQFVRESRSTNTLEQSEHVADAERSYREAMNAVGMPLNGALYHVCVVGCSAGEWATKTYRHRNSGIELLRVALDYLHQHYEGRRKKTS